MRLILCLVVLLVLIGCKQEEVPVYQAIQAKESTTDVTQYDYKAGSPDQPTIIEEQQREERIYKFDTYKPTEYYFPEYIPLVEPTLFAPYYPTVQNQAIIIYSGSVQVIIP